MIDQAQHRERFGRKNLFLLNGFATPQVDDDNGLTVVGPSSVNNGGDHHGEYRRAMSTRAPIGSALSTCVTLNR